MKHEINIAQLRKAKWKKVEDEVVEKLKFIHAVIDTIEINDKNEAFVREVIFPLIKLIAKFCTAINLSENEAEIKLPQSRDEAIRNN